VGQRNLAEIFIGTRRGEKSFDKIRDKIGVNLERQGSSQVQEREACE